MHLHRQHSYWAKSRAIKYTLRPIKIYYVRYYVIQNTCCINFSSQFLPLPTVIPVRTRRITDKWRTLLSRDVTAMKQFTCLNSDYSCSSRNQWLLLDQHQIGYGSVDSAAPSSDCCAIDGSIDGAALSVDGANPSIARDMFNGTNSNSICWRDTRTFRRQVISPWWVRSPCWCHPRSSHGCWRLMGSFRSCWVVRRPLTPLYVALPGSGWGRGWNARRTARTGCSKSRRAHSPLVVHSSTNISLSVAKQTQHELGCYCVRSSHIVW